MRQPIYKDIPFLVSVHIVKDRKATNAITNDGSQHGVEIQLIGTQPKGYIDIETLSWRIKTDDTINYSFGKDVTITAENITDSTSQNVSGRKIENIQLKANAVIKIDFTIQTIVSARVGIVLIDVSYTKNGRKHHITIPVFITIQNYELIKTYSWNKKVNIQLYWKNPLYDATQKALIKKQNGKKLWEIQSNKLLLYDRSSTTTKAIEIKVTDEEKGGCIDVYTSYSDANPNNHVFLAKLGNAGLHLYNGKVNILSLSALNNQPSLTIRNLNHTATVRTGIDATGNRKFILYK